MGAKFSSSSSAPSESPAPSVTASTAQASDPASEEVGHACAVQHPTSFAVTTPTRPSNSHLFAGCSSHRRHARHFCSGGERQSRAREGSLYCGCGLHPQDRQVAPRIESIPLVVCIVFIFIFIVLFPRLSDTGSRLSIILVNSGECLFADFW